MEIFERRSDKRYRLHLLYQDRLDKGRIYGEGSLLSNKLSLSTLRLLKNAYLFLRKSPCMSWRGAEKERGTDALKPALH